MPKGDKYIGLANYLKSKTETTITMTFEEIEKLIGNTLPQSAYKHRAFWSNTSSHSVAYGWINSDYQTESVDFSAKKVTFVKM